MEGEIADDFSAISLYPNPTNGDMTLYILMPENSSLSIKIMDLKGQVLLNQYSNELAGNYSQIFNMSAYSKGIYFLTITTDKETYTRKVVVE